MQGWLSDTLELWDGVVFGTRQLGGKAESCGYLLVESCETKPFED
jgi:hypothetical protein